MKSDESRFRISHHQQSLHCAIGSNSFECGAQKRVAELHSVNAALLQEGNKVRDALMKSIRDARDDASRRGSEARHHNRTVTYLRQRDALLKQQLQAAIEVIHQASDGLDAAPFPPPPQPITTDETENADKALTQPRPNELAEPTEPIVSNPKAVPRRSGHRERLRSR